MKMTAFDEALEIAFALNNDKWQLGSKLRIAIDEENRTIREFCLRRDGNYDHEDSYGNYVMAVRFRKMILDVPEYMTLMTLPISYFWNAYRAHEKGVDFELILEWLLDSFQKDGSKLSVRILQDKIKQALGHEKTMEDYTGLLMRLWHRMKPIIIGRKSALNVSEAVKAQAIEYHMNEIERLIDAPTEEG